MPLFSESNNLLPGAYVEDVIIDTGAALQAASRIPVFIGEGEETRSFAGVELHRGSSASAPEAAIRENLSSQVDGLTRKFRLSYGPVVLSGGDAPTNNVTALQVWVNGIPQAVSSLDGLKGEFFLSEILPEGADLRVSYYFKRGDTLIVDEDLSAEVPKFASASINGVIKVSTSLPGALGNLVRVDLVVPKAFVVLQGVKFEAQTAGLPGAALKVAFVFGGTFGATVVGDTLTYTIIDTTQAEIVGLGNHVVSGITITPSLVGSGSEIILPTPSPVSLALEGKSDLVAVSGATSDTITVHLIDSFGHLRTNAAVVALLGTAAIPQIPTLSSGYLVASLISNGADAAVAGSFPLLGGAGPSTAKAFKTHYAPIVSGTNGGVVTADPKHVSVKVNDVPVVVTSVNGAEGYVTLAQNVPEDATLKISYHINGYQDTFDVLPGDNITELTNVGFAAGRMDFIDGVDFVLEKTEKGAVIQWGASASVNPGVVADGSNPLDAETVAFTLVDEKVYFRPVAGAVDGRNVNFTLEDVPTDGRQLSKASNNPMDVLVYAGADIQEAMASLPLRVVGVIGASKKVTLYNPPALGQKLFATYFRNVLNDHKYTLQVVTPGISGQGDYLLKDELGVVMPQTLEDAQNHHVASANFATTGIVWPFAFPDLKSQGPDEDITLTFEDDGLNFPIQSAVSAWLDVTPGLRFTSNLLGTESNAVKIELVYGDGSHPVTVVGKTITIDINDGAGGVLHLNDVAALTPIHVVDGAFDAYIHVAVKVGVSGELQAEENTIGGEFLHGGALAIVDPYAIRFTVSSSLGSVGSSGTGFLGQTFLETKTGLQFTLVDPSQALGYGHTSLPSPAYRFKAGDTLRFRVSKVQARKTGRIPTLDIPGLRVRVETTLGMGVGNTAILSTYNKSGKEPAIGDTYVVDYKTSKTSADFGLKIFNKVSEAYSEYGMPSVANRLSLAVRLFALNGGQQFACIQVPKQTGMDIASEQSFIDAIASLAQPLPGSEQKADLILPLSSKEVVIQALNRHLLTQSSARQNGDATAYVGFSPYTTLSNARLLSRSLKAERICAPFPGGAVTSLTINGKNTEFVVGGEFIAAAVAGLDVQYDVATSLTKKVIVGFSRLAARYDTNDIALGTADGLMWLVEVKGGLKIVDYVTTDPSNVITRDPANRKTTNLLKRRLKAGLDTFVARKMLANLVNDVTITTNNILKLAVDGELIKSYKAPEVEEDPNDPTVLYVSVEFQHVSTLRWLGVRLMVSTKI